MAGFPWFAAEGLSSRVPKEACRVRAAAFRNFFDSRAGDRQGRRVGFPGWRKRKHGSRFRHDADRARPVGDRAVKLPGIGTVRTREKVSWLTGRIGDGGARVIGAAVKERAGRWWVSFQIEIDRSDINTARRGPGDAPAGGVDLGVETFAAVAGEDGAATEIHAPKALARAQRKLRKANKALARKQRGSANRVKAARQVAEVHLRVAHRRADFLHQTTTRLARTKRAIAVETLNVAGVVGNRRPARAISDQGFAEFVRQLEYKTGWYGSTVWRADQWFPSIRLCGDCGTINADLTLADRRWRCGCGAVRDRDVNAARNLLNAMATELEPAA